MFSKLSKIKAVTKAYYSIDIEKESPCLKAFLKKVQADSKKKIKKASVFTYEQMKRFLQDFPNYHPHLKRKVIMICGVFGALRGTEIHCLLRLDVLLQPNGDYNVYITPLKTGTANLLSCFS